MYYALNIILHLYYCLNLSVLRKIWAKPQELGTVIIHKYLSNHSFRYENDYYYIICISIIDTFVYYIPQ